MILVTLGVASNPFNRLIDWVDRLRRDGAVNEPLLLQHGFTSVEKISHSTSEFEFKPTLDEASLRRAVSEARLVISHAGQGSARMLADLGKSFVLVPRLAQYGEAPDDHQLDFVRALSRYGAHSAETYDKLLGLIKAPPPPFRGKLLPGPALTDFLIKAYPPRAH